MSPLKWGILAGGLVGWLIAKRRAAGLVDAAPKIPKRTRQRNRRNLPGQERGIGGN